jgi:RND superfamily putative drug exporter
MALLGRANWYLPRWLDRVLPNLDPHGAEGPVQLPKQRGESAAEQPIS